MLVLLATLSLLVYWRRRSILRLPGAWSSPLRSLPGPTNNHWLLGGLDVARLLSNRQVEVIQETTVKYGHVWTAQLPLFQQVLCPVDGVALCHVLNSSAFDVPATEMQLRKYAFGGGLATSTGEVHRRQRRVLRPALSSQDQAHYEVIRKQCQSLVQRWQKKSSLEKEKVDVLEELELFTLDVLGLIAFDFDFHGLQQGTTKLSKALGRYWQLLTSGSALAMLRMIPLVGDFAVFLARLLRIEEQVQFDAARREVTEVAQELVQHGQSLAESKIALIHALPPNTDLVAMVTALVIGGHDTVATTAAWGLHSLACHPIIQQRLREEVLGSDVDELASLPYLDAVVKEVLRMHAVVGLMQRVACIDTTIPLFKPVPSRDGLTSMDRIAIQRGDVVLIPIQAYNLAEHVWGADAHELRPERWLDPTATLTFSSGVSLRKS